MKEYFWGSAAVIFSVSAILFTNPQIIGKKRTSYDFIYFSPTASYNSTSVNTLTNWYISTIYCDGSNRKACHIEVEESYTYDDNGVRKLRTASQGGDIISLITAGTAAVKYIVSGTGVMSITNKFY